MSEPTTVNKGIIIPNTGDLVGSWGTTAINANMNALDGILGGFATISLSSATTITLSAPAASLTPGAGPTQSQNALIKFTGTLTGNAVIGFAYPGFFIVHNACTVNTFKITLSPSAGGGNSICAPPGRKTHIFYDGTDLDYVDMPEVGAALDLHGATAMPPWISGCSVSPYLIKDGSTYSSSIFPALSALLGSTFGGNGITTFGIPDERSRARIALDTLSIATGTYAGRVTFGGSGIIGTTMGAAGGDQLLQQHSHTTNDHNHTGGQAVLQNGNTGPTGFTSWYGAAGTTAMTNVTVNAAGTGAGQNMPPVIVSFLPLIKT